MVPLICFEALNPKPKITPITSFEVPLIWETSVWARFALKQVYRGVGMAGRVGGGEGIKRGGHGACSMTTFRV